MHVTSKARAYKRSRNQFKAALVYELNRRGEALKPTSDYRSLYDAVLRHLTPVRK